MGDGTSYGIGGFVKGLVAGATLRSGFDERKRRQRQDDEDRAQAFADREQEGLERKRRQAIEDENMNWTREERARKQELYAREDEEWERDKKKRDEEEGVFRKAADDTNRSIQNKKDERFTRSIQTAAPDPAAPPQLGEDPARIPARMPRGYAAVGEGPGAPTRARGGQPTPGAVDPALAAPTGQPTEPPAQDYGRARAGRGLVYTNPPAAAPQPTGTSGAPVPGVMVEPQAGIGRSIAPPTRARGGQPTPPPVTPGGAGPAAPDGTARAAVPSASPDGTAVTPSVEIAATTARGVTGRSESAAEDDFMTEYRKVGVPQIVEHFLKTGRVDEAKSFQTWIDDEETKEGQRAWARGVQAAQQGDEEGFFNHLTDAYNTTGYFDDGYEAVREKSGLKRDAEGNITGAFITYKDQETGQEQRTDYDDIEDLYRMGIQFLSPEAVFEHGMEQIKEADALRTAQIEHEQKLELEREKAGLRKDGKGKTPEQELAAEVESLRKNDLTGRFSSLPAEEQAAAALANIEARRKALAGFGTPQVGTVAARGE